MEYRVFTIKIPRIGFRWCRFSLQTVLLLMVIISLGLGWWRDHNRLQHEIHSLRFPSRGWDSNQATGPPNTQGAGDISTAWASQTPDGQREWLLLEYEESVVPSAVVIHETYNPGAVYKVSAITSFGREVVLWQGTDPTPPTAARGVSTIPVKADFRTWKIKVYIDSPKFPGWNEIDAVGVRDSAGSMQWATRAYASSSFGQSSSPFSPSLISLAP